MSPEYNDTQFPTSLGAHKIDASALRASAEATPCCECRARMEASERSLEVLLVRLSYLEDELKFSKGRQNTLETEVTLMRQAYTSAKMQTDNVHAQLERLQAGQNAKDITIARLQAKVEATEKANKAVVDSGSDFVNNFSAALAAYSAAMKPVGVLRPIPLSFLPPALPTLPSAADAAKPPVVDKPAPAKLVAP